MPLIHDLIHNGGTALCNVRKEFWEKYVRLHGCPADVVLDEEPIAPDGRSIEDLKAMGLMSLHVLNEDRAYRARIFHRLGALLRQEVEVEEKASGQPTLVFTASGPAKEVTELVSLPQCWRMSMRYSDNDTETTNFDGTLEQAMEKARSIWKFSRAVQSEFSTEQGLKRSQIVFTITSFEDEH